MDFFHGRNRRIPGSYYDKTQHWAEQIKCLKDVHCESDNPVFEWRVPWNHASLSLNVKPLQIVYLSLFHTLLKGEVSNRVVYYEKYFKKKPYYLNCCIHSLLKKFNWNTSDTPEHVYRNTFIGRGKSARSAKKNYCPPS